jgi:hypothetical protein
VTATLSDAVETVDPPEVVRETAGVDRVLRLLILYRNKLRRAITDYQALPPINNQGHVPNPIRDVALAEPHRKRFRPLQPAVRKLAQYASGLIENARIPQLDKIELQLRLAELEAALDIATQTIR